MPDPIQQMISNVWIILEEIGLETFKDAIRYGVEHALIPHHEAVYLLLIEPVPLPGHILSRPSVN